jgi:hypothetical protein
VLTLIGVGHKLIKIEQDSKALKPLLEQLKPIVSQAVPIVQQVVTDIKAPITTKDSVNSTAKTGGFISMKILLGLLVLVSLLWIFVPSYADDIKLDLGIVTLDLQGNVDAGGFFNFKHQIPNDNALTTITTNVGFIPIATNTKLNIALGVVTGPVDVGHPFGSIGYGWQLKSGPFCTTIGATDLKAGLGVSTDFCQSGYNWDNTIIGISVSMNIFNFITPPKPIVIQGN